jgi:type II secretory pathway pseudopilin PulG
MMPNERISEVEKPMDRGEKGFTIIEICVALILTIIISVGVIPLFMYAVRHSAGATDRERAIAVAQKRMEWLRTIPFNATNRNLAYSFPSGGLGATAATGVTETWTSGDSSYTIVTTISDVPPNDSNGNPTRKTITVQVTPIGSNSIFGQVTITTQRSTL